MSRPAPITLHGALALALSSLALGGCLRGPSTIERTLGAERRRGPWVPPSGYEHFVRAELAVEAGELRTALTEYELARSGIVDGYLLAREAEVAARLPDVALAERLVAEGLRDDPHSEPLWLVRAQLAQARGDLDAAEQALRAAHEGAPQSAAPVLALAELLVARGRAPEALTRLDAFVAHRPRDVPALRALLARALAESDAWRASLAALRLVRASPIDRAEVRVAIERALEAGHAPLAHAVFRALPLTSTELPLRFAVALAAHDRAECERLLVHIDDGSRAGRLRAAEGWLALGEGARAQELAEATLLTDAPPAQPPEPRVQRVLAHAYLLQHRYGLAAELLSQIPQGTSEEPARRALLRETLTRAGLPGLANEVFPAPSAQR